MHTVSDRRLAKRPRAAHLRPGHDDDQLPVENSATGEKAGFVISHLAVKEVFRDFKFVKSNVLVSWCAHSPVFSPSESSFGDSAPQG